MGKNKNYSAQNAEEQPCENPKTPLRAIRYLIYATILILLFAAISYKNFPFANSNTPSEQESVLLLLMQELAKDPHNSDLLMAVGQEFMVQHNLPSAIEFFEEAKLLDPDNAELLYNLGLAQFQSSDASAAELNLKTALTLQTNEQICSKIRYTLALLYMEKQPLKAQEYLKEILQSQEVSLELRQSTKELLKSLESN